MQRVRIRYAKRGRLRFSSHRDFARAFERALRRAAVPVAFSAGFSPHPRVSYLGAAPTGVASEAEYLELALAQRVDPGRLATALDAALPAGLDVVECVEARAGAGGLADRIDASSWRVELLGVPAAAAAAAVTAFLARESVPVERLTKDGRRTVDARAAVVSAAVRPGADVSGLDAGDAATPGAADPDGAETADPGGAAPADPAGPDTDDLAGPEAADPGGHGAGDLGGGAGRAGGPGAPRGGTVRDCAILDVVVRQATPAVRPDDVLAALRVVADLVPPVPPRSIRLAQGLLDDSGRLADPLARDRAAVPPAGECLEAMEERPGSAEHQAPSLGTTSGD